MSALAIVAMTALLMSGVCVLASTQEVKQHRDADYAHAMQLAEAGINYELNCSSNGTCSGNSGSADTSSAPYTGSVSGLSGSFSVYANSVNPTQITSTGTVGSGNYAVSRTVQVNVSGSSVFNGAYTLFGTQSTSVSSANVLSGTVGSNATVSGTPSSKSSCQVVSNCTTNYDTCDHICSKCFPNGWSTLSNSTSISNQCSNIYCYWSSWFQINSAFWCTQANYPPTINHTTTSPTTFTDAQCQCYNGSTIILEPGDYYCTSCNVKNCNIVWDNNCSCCASSNSGSNCGPCRLWCGGSGGGNDSICCSQSCTNSSASLAPKCFYDKPGCSCTLTCSSGSCCCGVYGVCQGKSGSKTSSCSCILDKCTGNVSGTVIADNVTVTSASTGTVSAMNLSNPTDPQMAGGYGFSGGWVELKAPSAGAVFTDGTNN